MGTILIKRVYAPAQQDDGYRVLVDRLWPRGLSKERLGAQEWAKQMAPSTGLRKAFGHMSENFPSFRLGYLKELDAHPEGEAFASKVKELLKKGNVTLLYAAANEQANHALVLREWLNARF